MKGTATIFSMHLWTADMGCYPNLGSVRGLTTDYLNVLYIHVTVRHNRIPFKQPTRRTNYPNLFCYKSLHVSGILSVHHQEFSTVHLAVVSFMQVLMTASKQRQDGTQFHPVSAWKRSSKPARNLPLLNVQ